MNVKLSVCNRCKLAVRVAVEHMMTTEMVAEFDNEVKEFNLIVKNQSLFDYQKENLKWCNCLK